ncbi:unnamed protein product [Chrysoparadoxa australica]
MPPFSVKSNPAPGPPPSTSFGVRKALTAAIAGVMVFSSPLSPALSESNLAPPISTITGTWRIKESSSRGEGICRSRVTFRGFVEEPLKGTLAWEGKKGYCEGESGSGRWLLKPGRQALRYSARWKVKVKEGETVLYRGDVVPDSSTIISQGGVDRPDYHIRYSCWLLQERPCPEPADVLSL